MERDESTLIREAITIRELKHSIENDVLYRAKVVSAIDDPSIVEFTETPLLNTRQFTEFLERSKERNDISSRVILFCAYRYYVWTRRNKVDTEERSTTLAGGIAECIKVYFDRCENVEYVTTFPAGKDDVPAREHANPSGVTDKDYNISSILETNLTSYYKLDSYSERTLSSWPAPLYLLHPDFFPLYDAVSINDFIDYIVPCILGKDDYCETNHYRDMNFKLLRSTDRYVFFNLTMRWLCDFQRLTYEGRCKLIEAFKDSMDRLEFLIAVPFCLFAPKRIVKMKCNYLYETVTNVSMPDIARQSYDFIKNRCNATYENCQAVSSRLPTIDKFVDGEEINVKCLSYILGVLPRDLLFKIELYASEIYELNLLSQDEGSIVEKMSVDSSMYIYKKFFVDVSSSSSREASMQKKRDYDRDFYSASSDVKCINCEKPSIADVTLLQCGHANCCASCAYTLAKCPVCNSFIIYRVKTDNLDEAFHRIQRSILLGVAELFNRSFEETRNILLPREHVYTMRNQKWLLQQ